MALGRQAEFKRLEDRLRPSRSQAARAVRAAGSCVPGPRISAAKGRCWRLLPMSDSLHHRQMVLDQPTVCLERRLARSSSAWTASASCLLLKGFSSTGTW